MKGGWRWSANHAKRRDLFSTLLIIIPYYEGSLLVYNKWTDGVK